MTDTLPRLSHSAVDDFLTCEEKYRLKRVEKVPTKPAVWLPAGRAFHRWTEAYELGAWLTDELPDWSKLLDEEIEATKEKAGEDVPVDEWRTAGRKTKEWPAGDTIERWRDHLGPEMCEKFVDWHATNGLQLVADLPPDPNGNTVGVEYEMSFRIEGIEVKAYVDRVFRDAQGRMLVVDYKTGQRVPRNTQLPLYALGLLKKGVIVTHAAYYMARKGEMTTPFEVSSWYEAKMARIYRTAAERIAAGSYIPNPGEACSRCDVFSSCLFALRSHG